MRVANRDVVAERDLDAAEGVEEELLMRDALEDAVEADCADRERSRHVEVLDDVGDLAGREGVEHAVRAEGAVEAVAFASS